MNPFEQVSLGNLAGGGAEEMFQRELKRVLENIVDPNTSAEAPRGITITLKIAPNERRDGAAMVVGVVSKLAPSITASGALYVGRDADGRQTAVQNCAVQSDIFSVQSTPSLPNNA